MNNGAGISGDLLLAKQRAQLAHDTCIDRVEGVAKNIGVTIPDYIPSLFWSITIVEMLASRLITLEQTVLELQQLQDEEAE